MIGGALLRRGSPEDSLILEQVPRQHQGQGWFTQGDVAGGIEHLGLLLQEKLYNSVYSLQPQGSSGESSCGAREERGAAGDHSNPARSCTIYAMVQSDGDDLYQGMAFRHAVSAKTPARFSGCASFRPRASG